MSAGDTLGAVKRRSVEDEVYARLRDAILRGELAGGERLVHEKLATRFATSRIPVRDAIKRLAHDGLVEIDARRVSRVTQFGADDIEEIYTLRRMLEPHAVACACPLLSAGDLEDLRALQTEIDAAAQHGERSRYVELNQRFHFDLYGAADQPRLERMIEGLWRGLPPLTPITLGDCLRRSAAEHHEILDALHNRAANAAAEAMRVHIANAQRELSAQLERR